MCGLFGAFRANKALFDTKIVSLMEHGLYVSALRGNDGTGIGLVEASYEAAFSKSHLDAPNFLQTRHWAWAKKYMSMSRACLGHTRSSTNPNTYNSEGAHPFVWEVETADKKMDAVMLTHNGHCSDAFNLTPHDFTHPVDSANIAYALLLAGHDRAEDVLEKLNGFYVLVWYNQLAKTLNICRNESNRELYLVTNKAKTQIYYASEKEMLKFALDRCEIEVDKNYWELKPFVHYTWDLTKDSLDKPHARKYEEKKASSYKGRHTGGTLPGTTRNNGGTGSEPTTLVNPLHPIKGDIIYGDFRFVAGTRGTWHANRDGSGKETSYGYIYGTRKLDKDSSIKLLGVQKSDLTYYADIIEELPIKIHKVEKQENATVGAFLYYEGSIDRQRADLGLRNKNARPDYSAQGYDLVKGWNGQIQRWRWKEIAKAGCSECDGDILDSDVGHVGFIEHPLNPEDHAIEVERQMVCPECCKAMSLEEAGEKSITLPREIIEMLENQPLPDAPPDKAEDEDFVPGPLDAAQSS